MDDRSRIGSRAPAPALGGPAAAAPSAHRGIDEAAADAARSRLHERGIVPIEPDERIGVMLAPDELIVAVRRSVAVDRRERCRDDAPGVAGDLYVTTRRLLHLGRTTIAYPVDQIRDAIVAADRLLLLVGEHRGLAIGVGDPRVLRVEIAAARAAARAEGHESQPVDAGQAGTADAGLAGSAAADQPARPDGPAAADQPARPDGSAAAEDQPSSR